MDKKIISLVAPSYNESENIRKFYESIKSIFSNLNYEFEIIFVNDGSRDNTLELMLDLHSEDSRVKVINLSRNFGKEIALTAGLDNAEGDGVIPIDVDLQDPPEVIPQLISKWEEGYDMVYAVRSKRDGEGPMKKFTAFLFYRLIASVTKIKIPKDTGDFRILDRRAILALRELREYHRFMKGLFTWVGFKQVGIQYRRNPRFAGKSKFNFMKLLNLAIEGFTSFTVAPLRFATILGLIISLTSILYAVYIIIKTMLNGIDVPGYSSLMVAVLFLGGVQLLSIGIIGEYIGRIFNETKNRPLYLVRDRVGF
jgi:glycosyltransferase involved in cell wall biosynthesis